MQLLLGIVIIATMLSGSAAFDEARARQALTKVDGEQFVQTRSERCQEFLDANQLTWLHVWWRAIRHNIVDDIQPLSQAGVPTPDLTHLFTTNKEQSWNLLRTKSSRGSGSSKVMSTSAKKKSWCLLGSRFTA